MARDWIHWGDNSTEGLPIDEMMIGQIRTRSSDSYVTDSSSSATAYSCGIKTYNGVFSFTGFRWFQEFANCGRGWPLTMIKSLVEPFWKLLSLRDS